MLRRLSAEELEKTNMTDVDDSIVELVEALEVIDEHKPSAQLNEYSMIDSKGSRIYY